MISPVQQSKFCKETITTAFHLCCRHCAKSIHYSIGVRVKKGWYCKECFNSIFGGKHENKKESKKNDY
jgi:hypothetical protein